MLAIDGTSTHEPLRKLVVQSGGKWDIESIDAGRGEGVDIVNGIRKLLTTSDSVVCQLLLQWASGAPLSPQ